jgi:hypothetical protein
MKTDLTDIVRNRAEINSILRDSIPKSTGSSTWISPHEKHLPRFGSEVLGDDANSIKSLVDLHSSIFSRQEISQHKISKLIILFDNAVLPESAPPRPTLNEVRTQIEAGTLNIGIYNASGYNFSLEYSHVYNGENIPGRGIFLRFYPSNFPTFDLLDTAFDDILAIAARAIRAIDPAVDLKLSKLYAEYISRIAAWEVSYANAIALATLTSKFPMIKARIFDKLKFYSPHIYIGTLLCRIIPPPENIPSFFY